MKYQKTWSQINRPVKNYQDLYRFIAMLVFMAGLIAFCWAFSSYNDTLINLYY